jgi:nitrous oxide reductase accessory protein NosL
MTDRRTFVTTRRRVVVGTSAAIALAGCAGSTDDPAPVSLTDAGGCDQCGMVIAGQPGPVGQTYYRENDPDGHDPPARFCSTICTFRHRFAANDRGWTPRVTYLTDYADVDYSVREEGDARVLSAHPAAESFAATDTLVVVAGTDVEGAMGPALVPFGEADAAEAFASTYGGEILEAEAISRELVSRG